MKKFFALVPLIVLAMALTACGQFIDGESCSDGIKNQNETDLDCGGICTACVDGKICLIDDDCASGNCDQGICAPARDEICDDGSQPVCPMPAPECAAWEILAVIDGCWSCVDPATCRPWGEPGCFSDQDCAPAELCDPCARGSCPNCEDCVADCRASGCHSQAVPECDGPRPNCADGQVAVVRDGCWLCVDLLTCEPARDTSCDDGSQALCDMIPPVCQPHEILAIQNDCWACVNPATCHPWGEPGCRSDGECDPDQWCDPCRSGSCPMCPDCVAGCAPHRCPTGGWEDLQCAMPRPDCGFEWVAIIRDGCWVCVDRLTCEPARDTACDDGSEVLCNMIPPICDPVFEILAVQANCWVCVNPATCRPWGEPGCAVEADCDPDQTCDPCGTSSCPDCDNCLPACLDHGCPSESELLCNCARPDCGPDAVSIIDQGCWICVDQVTCQPTGDGC